MIRFACVAAVMLASIAVSADQAHAQAPLFSQYTTQGAGSPSAALYPAPHWSPILGAESYYTYQPLMPHEMMYQHSRNYYNYYDGGYKGGGQGSSKNFRSLASRKPTLWPAAAFDWFIWQTLQTCRSQVQHSWRCQYWGTSSIFTRRLWMPQRYLRYRRSLQQRPVY